MSYAKVFEILAASLNPGKNETCMYAEITVTSKSDNEVNFEFKQFGLPATLSCRGDSVNIKTRSLFGVPPNHPASFAIQKKLEERALYTKIVPSEGLVFLLDFRVDDDFRVVANGRTVSPYFQELIGDMERSIAETRNIVIEKLPYLAGQRAIRVGGETVIVSSVADWKQIGNVDSTTITKPNGSQFTTLYNDVLPMLSDVNDDDARLLPNFYFDGNQLFFFAPKMRHVETRGNLSAYEMVGTEKYDSTPFFAFLKKLLDKIRELPNDEQRNYYPIPEDVKHLLVDPALIGTLGSKTILVALNADIRDTEEFFKEDDQKSVITKEDLTEMGRWQKLIGDAIEYGKTVEGVTRARFAARDIEHTPETLGAEKRTLSRSGGGFSVYITPSEAQVCRLQKDVAVKLVEEEGEKKLVIEKV